MASCQNTSKTPAIDMANFDLSVAPDADFYQYATGGWQKNNPLKPEYSRYGSFDVLPRMRDGRFVDWHPLTLTIHAPIYPQGKGLEYERKTMDEAYQTIMADLDKKYQGYVENPDQ